MATVGYARVSSVGQSLDVQLEKLKGCDKVFKEKRSGSIPAGRHSSSVWSFSETETRFRHQDRSPGSLDLGPLPDCFRAR